jgi:CBS domain-containing protein
VDRGGRLVGIVTDRDLRQVLFYLALAYLQRGDLAPAHALFPHIHGLP